MNPRIFLLAGDDTLCSLLAEGLSRHAVIEPRICDTISALKDSCAEAGRVVLIFDPAFLSAFEREAESLLAQDADVLPLFIDIVPGRIPPAAYVPSGNVISCPLRLGALTDRVNRHLLVRTRRWGDREHIPVGPYMLLPGKNLLTGDGGGVIHLTEKERDILVRLEQARGTAVDRQTLLTEVWGYVEEAETHTLETHIYRLRQKIEDDPARPRYLVTDDTGYRLAGGEEA